SAWRRAPRATWRTRRRLKPACRPFQRSHRRADPAAARARTLPFPIRQYLRAAVCLTSLNSPSARAGSLRQWNDVVQRGLGRRKKLLDSAAGLPDAVLVFDESEANVALAIFTEPQSGRHRYAGFLKEKLRKFERSNLRHRRRQRNPGKHRSGGWGNGPAGTIERLDEAIAPVLVGL